MAAALDQMDVVYRKFDPADPRMAPDLLAFKPDMAFPALHGPGGEDGSIQGFLETAQIPYVGSGVAASALCMNKLSTKWAFEALGIPTPRWCLVDPFADFPKNLPPFPVVAKPLMEGSSVGVEFVSTADDLRALVDRRKTPLLVEERIVGRELTLPVFGDPMELLPVIEICPKKEFFDFDAKYTKGMTEYICPAEIKPELHAALSRYAGLICRAFGLRHMSRIDLMIGSIPPTRSDDAPLPGMGNLRAGAAGIYFLEVNTIPGMTETSLLPMAARACGIDFPSLIRRLIQMAGGMSS